MLKPLRERKPMRKIVAIAENTVREELRKKGLNVLLLFAVVLIIGSRSFGWLAPGEEMKIVKDTGLAGIMFFGMLIAIFGTSGLIPGEIEKKTIYTLLAKPVRRFEFVLGKFLGGTVTVLIYFTIMSAVFLGMIFIKERIVDPDIVKALILTFFELEVLVAITTAVSTLASTLFNVTFTFFIWVVGHLTDNLVHMAEMARNRVSKAVLLGLYNLLPNFNNFNVRDHVVVGDPVPLQYLAAGINYGLGVCAVMLILAFLFFNEREV